MAAHLHCMSLLSVVSLDNNRYVGYLYNVYNYVFNWLIKRYILVTEKLQIHHYLFAGLSMGITNNYKELLNCLLKDSMVLLVILHIFWNWRSIFQIPTIILEIISFEYVFFRFCVNVVVSIKHPLHRVSPFPDLCHHTDPYPISKKSRDNDIGRKCTVPYRPNNPEDWHCRQCLACVDWAMICGENNGSFGMRL